MASSVLHALDLRQLDPNELKTYRDLVESVPGVEHDILSIYQRGPDELEVCTGSQSGPWSGTDTSSTWRGGTAHWVVNHERTATWQS